MRAPRTIIWLSSVASILAASLISSSSLAAVCDLTAAGSSCSLQDGAALFFQADPRPTGTGVIESFVRIQDHGTQQGYNTDGRPVAFNEKTDPNFTRSLLLTEVPVVTIDGVAYREFGLDINEASSGAGRPLSLDELMIFQSSTGNLTTSNLHALGSLVYDLDAGGDAWITLNYSLGSGSGSGDMFAYINDALFASPAPYVTVYSQFGLMFPSDAGFEEWWVRDGGNGMQPPIPEPTSVLLLATGLAALGAWLAQRPTSSSRHDC